jgi:hypothetical protein
MPTGLAWNERGELIVCSLEGRVWRAVDRDGDGLQDELQPISDTYPAPYGIAAHGEAIDLLCKFGLVRLSDDDRDGFFEHAQIIADGWGYSADYHDWAVGLPRDRAGNYYVALPCQQDDRTQAEAKLRGTIVRLKPRKTEPDESRLFEIEPIASGLRFPMGLALSANEQLFATDNQGNYTAFNELNHIRSGERYGFVNKLDSQRGVKSEPHERAAIEIPHPWTRSVNGICFLTRDDAQAKVGHHPFGPWTGHLLGCEYDTRRLVRMSLETVDGVYQGGVYPVSREPREGEPTFEGPLVCQVSPRGEIFVGNIRDSGWGAGANTGSLVRLRYSGELPAGIAEIKSLPKGFRIVFSRPADEARARNTANYAISSYTRTPTPAYGGPDENRRNERINSLTVAKDRMTVDVELAELRPGFVYEFRLRPLVRGEFFPDEAYYTLRKAPK